MRVRGVRCVVFIYFLFMILSRAHVPERFFHRGEHRAMAWRSVGCCCYFAVAVAVCCTVVCVLP